MLDIKNRAVKEKVWNFQEKFILKKKESRSSHWRCSIKRSVLKNLENSQENTCARAAFSIVAGLRPADLLKNRLWQRCFSVNFAKFLKTAFFLKTSGGCFWESSISLNQLCVKVIFYNLINSVEYGCVY